MWVISGIVKIPYWGETFSNPHRNRIHRNLKIVGER